MWVQKQTHTERAAEISQCSFSTSLFIYNAGYKLVKVFWFKNISAYSVPSPVVFEIITVYLQNKQTNKTSGFILCVPLQYNLHN